MHPRGFGAVLQRTVTAVVEVAVEGIEREFLLFTPPAKIFPVNSILMLSIVAKDLEVRVCECV